MKKSFLAILISSLVLLSACEDKQTQAKLQQAEQTVTQLQTEPKTTQDELAKVRSEIPVIFAKEVEIFNQSAEFKNPKPDAPFPESIASSNVSAVDTGVAWLNDLIYNKMIGDDFSIDDKAKEQEIKAIANAKDRLQAILAYNYEGARKSAEAFETRADEYSQTMRYIGQRQNVMTFEQNVYVDGGGAHPIGWTNYINIDANKKAIIDLESAFGKENLPQLKAALWEEYKAYNGQNEIKNESEFFVQKDELEPSPDFYFTVNGITFVYAPYAIGPYAEGEIKLSLPWEVARDLLKPEYVW